MEQINHPFDYFSVEEVFLAFFDCRKNKRNTYEVKKFEENQERNLMDLYHDLNNNTYNIGRSICFVVEYPKYREVWAGKFRDRIVHHIIYNRIFDRFSRSFIYDSYACLPGRGTLFGINRINKFVRRETHNYADKAYFLQADIKNFFVSINKNILNSIVQKKIEEPHLKQIISQVIFHDPTINPIYNSSPETFNLVPYHKSLFNSGYYYGLPIGNLTSQFFANIYLNEIDHYIKRKLKVKSYGRYIDDVVFISRDVAFLNESFKLIQQFAYNNLEVTFHPNKTIINTTDKGINFCGQVIKHHRKYIRNRTVKNIKQVFYKNTITIHDKWKNQISSYMGFLKWCNSYNLRKRLTKNVDLLFDNDMLTVKNFAPIQTIYEQSSNNASQMAWNSPDT